MTTKADYVRSQAQTRKHHCHWPGCEKQVPPAMWGCSRHWFRLPRELQLRIWSSYRPGQEIDGKPSANYIADAKAVQAWIADKEKAGTFLQVPAGARAAHSVSNERGNDPQSSHDGGTDGGEQQHA